MTDISSISSAHKLTSQLKVSLESVQKNVALQGSQLETLSGISQEVEQFEKALKLAGEIRLSLESSLQRLSN